MNKYTEIKPHMDYQIYILSFYKEVNISLDKAIFLYLKESQEIERPVKSVTQYFLLKREYQRIQEGRTIHWQFKIDRKARQKLKPNKRNRNSYRKTSSFRKNSNEQNCFFCKKEFGPGVGRTVDHFIPISRGGLNHPSNFRICCGSCNTLKKDIHPLIDTQKWHEFELAIFRKKYL